MRFIPAVSPVQIQVPLPDARDAKASRVSYGPLVKWLRHGPFTAVTWVRIPYGSPSHRTPLCTASYGQKKITYPYGGLAQLVRAPASHAGGHWFESSSLHQTLGILMISRVFSFIKKMIVFCFTVLSLYFLSKLIVFYRNEKETLSRLFFHYLSCTFLPLMWSMLMRNIWTALPEAATSSSTIFSVG